MQQSEQLSVDSMNRQVQINEWEYNSKMETLFMFQLILIGLLIITILSVLNSYGLVGRAFLFYVSGLVILILGGIWLARLLYTNRLRDKEVWTRRSFQGDAALPPAVSPDVVRAAATNNAAACAAEGDGSKSSVVVC